MNSPTRAHLPSPRHILPLFLFTRAKKRRFGAEPAPNLAKNSPFETKNAPKLQKKLSSSNFFSPPNSPDYPVCKPLSALFAGKSSEISGVMVNFLPIPLCPESSNSLFVHIFAPLHPSATRPESQIRLNLPPPHHPQKIPVAFSAKMRYHFPRDRVSLIRAAHEQP